MKNLIVVLAALVIGTAFAQAPDATNPARTFEQQKASICTIWTKNAMYGATQRLRGAKREAKFITEATLIELIEHRKGAEAIYFIEQQYTTEDRQWLITSAFTGYDWIGKWVEANPGQMLPDPNQAVADFNKQCLETPAFYIQFIEEKVPPAEK
jgi:hypothetical protein